VISFDEFDELLSQFEEVYPYFYHGLVEVV